MQVFRHYEFVGLTINKGEYDSFILFFLPFVEFLLNLQPQTTKPVITDEKTCLYHARCRHAPAGMPFLCKPS